MFRVTAEAAATASAYGARSKTAKSQPSQSDGFSALVDGNAQAVADTERVANTTQDAAPQRLDNGDAQAKTDNRTETKADNSSTGKDKPQTAQASHSNSETPVSAEDTTQPAETAVPGDSIKVVLSDDALAVVSEAKTGTDDAKQSVDASDAAAPAVPAIVANAAAVIAVAVQVTPTSTSETASAAPDSPASISAIESAAAASAVSAGSLPETSATTASAGASPAPLPVNTADATAVADTTVTAAADEPAAAATAKAATTQALTGEALPVDAESAANTATSAQIALPAAGNAKTSSPAPTTTTHTTLSADAEASDAQATAPARPGQTADASAPKGAERIDGKHDKSGTSADKADAPTTDAKPASASVATAPVEHRAPVAAAHSVSLDLNLPPVQNQPPQSFQAQAPNLVVNPAAQLNTTLANTPVPVSGLAIDIALRAAGGASRFEIRLDPAELGRIDVRLDVDRHGNVTSHLTVEKPATLDMLRRDAPQLQQALENAGLKTGDSGLQFSLRDQSSSGRNGNDGSDRNSQRLIISEDDTVPAQVAGRTYGRTLGSSGGVDIRV